MEQMLSRAGGLNRGAKIVMVGYWLMLTLSRPPQVTMPTTPHISATTAIQRTPRGTGARWECGEQMLSRAGGLNRIDSVT